MVWIVARFFYKHSEWLHTNKPITISSNRFPRLISKIGTLFYRNDFFLYFIMVPIALMTFIGALFLFILIGKGVFKEFESFLYAETWWGQVLIWSCIILSYFGFRISLDSKRQKSFLTSKKEEISKYKTVNVARKISEIDSNKIQTYPRFTMYDKNIKGKRHDQIIFDSSDFSVVNNAFGVMDSFNGNTVLTGKQIKFRNSEYFIEKVQVDFLNIFDDYSLNPFGGKHTSVYEGKDVPYNIQIFIDARKISNQ